VLNPIFIEDLNTEILKFEAKKKKKDIRAFPTHFASILYFTSSKSQFSILTTNFYKTPLIPFSILQYIILKYYKIILFLYIFFHTPTKPTAADQPQPQQADQPQPPITPTPTPTPANPNPNPHFVCNHCREGGEKLATESHGNHPNTNPITIVNHHHHHHQQIWKQPSTHHQQIRKQPPTHHRTTINPQPPPPSR
jgi:hypothetical protein